MKLENGQTILFTGDSITDCGRGRPLGERGGLGDGYVNLVNSLLLACYPERTIRVLNTGISGNRVTDLDSRWQVDILDHKPDWLSIMIGINDVWRQFDNDSDFHGQVDISAYETVYRKILDQARPNLTGLVLMTPYYIEDDPSDPMRAMMDKYGAVVEKLASDYDAVFVNTQAAFGNFMKHRPTQLLCWDRVHPGQAGHMIIARAFLNAMGFEWA